MYSTRLKTVLNKDKSLIPTYKKFYTNFTAYKSHKNKKNNFASFHAKKNNLSKIKEGVRLLNKYKSKEYKIVSKLYHLARKTVKPTLKSSRAKALLKCHNPCLLKLAERYYQAHNYPMSYAVARKAFEIQASGKAKNIMGLSALQRGEYMNAVEDFKVGRKQSVFKSKDYFEATFKLGLLYYLSLIHI